VSTEGHWVRDGLQIKKGEKPMKYAKSKAYMLKQFRLEYLIKKKAALPKDYELGDEMVPLYGKWQTEPYVPKPIVNVCFFLLLLLLFLHFIYSSVKVYI